MAMKIGLETPEEDYKNLIAEKVTSENVPSDDEIQDNFEKISASAREVVWILLFAKQPPSTIDQDMAAKLLQELKRDCCFYSPWKYNEWIVELRDELMKNNMLDFWREQIVKHELGPCWARDCDFFDNMDDPGPEAFYSHAGCVAIFSKSNKTTSVVHEFQAPGPAHINATTSVAPSKISLVSPTADYEVILKHQLELDNNDKERLSEIFSEVRRVIWVLLFDVKPLAKDNFEKAANLIVAYKRDACFYNPYDYNDWILQIRDELLSQKYYDFWQQVIVEKKCGLCWYKDCDFFDDVNDIKPIDFYKSGNIAEQSSTHDAV